ncbi:MAG: 30S ribosome-binding factor RbfA [Proteobacteria bacterium]|nr:30S ribosome-binding factor RbfA [Pseudomonadota bacterium]
MTHSRQRLSHELRARLAEIFARRVADPRLRGLAISEVRPSADFSYARVFYVGDEDLTAAIDRARPFVRSCLAEGLRLRRVPELDFRRDRSMDEARRIEQLLAEPGTSESEREGPAEEGQS